MPQPSQSKSLVLGDQEAAALFRICVERPLGGCQFEDGRMRWWLGHGLRIELIEGAWHLFVVPGRGGATREELFTSG